MPNLSLPQLYTKNHLRNLSTGANYVLQHRVQPFETLCVTYQFLNGLISEEKDRRIYKNVIRLPRLQVTSISTTKVSISYPCFPTLKRSLYSRREFLSLIHISEPTRLR